ncbi:MAG: hypothetical protein IH598_10200 [Bacteroidales bacterium]|nr:hypothetical protein [Bacteroidales bacterium]
MKQPVLNNGEVDCMRKPKESDAVTKLTALWGLSESALGGVLHAFKLPFRGMFISGIAIILISLIAKFSDWKGRITRSMLIVVMIKALISPHTPLQAYFSVVAQGILGELLFISKKIRLLSSLLFGIIVSLLNGFQKIIVLTLIYGQHLWRTIDDFYNFISQEWFPAVLQQHVAFSHWLIGGYILFHLIVGVAAGILAYIVPLKVEAKMHESPEIPILSRELIPVYPTKPASKKGLKPTGLAIVALSVVMILLSYLYPETSGFDITGILIMLGRSFLILVLWFYLLAPLIKTYLVKVFRDNSESNYAVEVDSVIDALPSMKLTIAESWSSSSQYKGINRLFQFLIGSLATTLKETKQYE